jgi:hypothetical protein
MWLGAGQSGQITGYDTQADCLSNPNLEHQRQTDLVHKLHLKKLPLANFYNLAKWAELVTQTID